MLASSANSKVSYTPQGCRDLNRTAKVHQISSCGNQQCPHCLWLHWSFPHWLLVTSTSGQRSHCCHEGPRTEWVLHSFLPLICLLLCFLHWFAIIWCLVWAHNRHWYYSVVLCSQHSCFLRVCYKDIWIALGLGFQLVAYGYFVKLHLVN